MDATPVRMCCIALLSIFCFASAACETLRSPGSTADWFSRTGKTLEREADANRQIWQSQRQPAAIRWLLSTQIRNGLTLEEVNQRLGDTGEKEQNTREFKREGDGFLVDDELYRFGPDREGEVYYLGFREGKVVNFEGDNYADPN